MTNIQGRGTLPLLLFVIVGGALIFAGAGIPSTMTFVQSASAQKLQGETIFASVANNQIVEIPNSGGFRTIVSADQAAQTTRPTTTATTTGTTEEGTTPTATAQSIQDRLSNGVDDLNCIDLKKAGMGIILTPVPDEDRLDKDGNGYACEGNGGPLPVAPQPQPQVEPEPQTPAPAEGIGQTNNQTIAENPQMVTQPVFQNVITELNAALAAYENGNIQDTINHLQSAKALLLAAEPIIIESQPEPDCAVNFDINSCPVEPGTEQPPVATEPTAPATATEPEQPQQPQQCNCQVLGNGFASLEQVLDPSLIGTEAFTILQNIIELYHLQIVGDALIVGNVQVEQTLNQTTEQTVDVVQSQLPDNFTEAIQNVTENTNITAEDVISNATESAIVEEIAVQGGIDDDITQSTDNVVVDVINNETTVQEAVQDSQEQITDAAQNIDVTPTDVQDAAKIVQQDPSTVYDQLNQAIATLESVKASLYGNSQ